MSAWSLPDTIQVDGRALKIRTDYRAVLDAISALNDAALFSNERVWACLVIMVPDIKSVKDVESATREVFKFIDRGAEDANPTTSPRLVDWDKDVHLIAPEVDKVLGYSCRRAKYLHWWEFIDAFGAIGRGPFAEVVSIRSKQAKHKKLEKWEREYIQEHPALFQTGAQELTAEEEAFFQRLGV